MSSESAIQRGKGLIANPAFFMIFVISVGMGVAGLGSIGVSGVTGYILAGVTAAVFAAAWFSGLGERLFVALIALAGLISGVVSAYVVFHLWGPVHGEYLWAALLALLIVVLPVGAIAGERVLPIFVALFAGVFGVLSVIVFVMVLFRVGMGA